MNETFVRDKTQHTVLQNKTKAREIKNKMQPN
jgi:hypothetical protein